MISTSAIRRESTLPVEFDDFFLTEYPRLVPMVHALFGDRGRAEDVGQEALAATRLTAWPAVSRVPVVGAVGRRRQDGAKSSSKRTGSATSSCS